MSRLSMVSLLRRNNKNRGAKKNNVNNHNEDREREVSRSSHSDDQEQRQRLEQRTSNKSVEIFNDNSLDSLVFAASLGLVSTHHPILPKDLMLVVQEPPVSPPPTKAPKREKGRRASAISSSTHEFYCKFCGKGYRWKSTMRRHESLECGDKPPSFQCPHCPYKARQRGNLTVHLKRHHQRH